MQANSPLERFTPSSRYCAPAAVSSLLPETRRAGAAPPVLPPLILIETAADVVAAPALSVARALTEYVPAATPPHENVYGAVVSEPTTVEPFRKSTRDTVPSASAAVAANATVPGAV